MKVLNDIIAQCKDEDNTNERIEIGDRHCNIAGNKSSSNSKGKESS